MSTLGSRIRDLRKKSKYTQEFIATKLDMGRSNFGHIENDRVIPSSEDLEKIADILGTTTDYLLGRNNVIAVAEEKSQYNVTPDEIQDLKQMLSKGNVTFDGIPIDEAQRQRVMDILTGLFWESAETKKHTEHKKKKGER